MFGLTKKKTSFREAIEACMVDRNNLAKQGWAEIREALVSVDEQLFEKVENERVVQHDAFVLMLMLELQYVRRNWSEGGYEAALGIIDEKVQEVAPHQQFLDVTRDAIRIYEHDCRRAIDLVREAAPMGMVRTQFANSFCRRNAIGVPEIDSDQDPGPVAEMAAMDLFMRQMPAFFPAFLKEFRVSG